MSQLDMIDGVRRCAVLGDPIEHSLSPALHRAAFAELGLAWTYDLHRVDEPGLPGFLAGLDESWRGLSVTMPLKRALLPMADVVTDVARLVGAGNTVVLDQGRRVIDNTDVAGAQRAMQAAGVESVGRATIRGGGATAASLLVTLAHMGCRSVQLAVRSPDRATETLEVARRLDGAISVECVPLATPAVGELVVSTIPAAAQTDEITDADSGADAVFEVIYNPWPTRVAQAATDRGQTLIGGLDLLVHQAALQCTAFTGAAAPLEAMMTAGRAALDARRSPPPS